MFMSGLAPILDYSSAVWGYSEIGLPKIDTIQYRAMRIFLAVHKHAHNLAVGPYLVTWDGPRAELDAT